MIKIESVGQFGRTDDVIKLLRELAVFERMEDEFHPKESSLQAHVSHNAAMPLHIYLAMDDGKAVGVVVFYVGEYSSFKTGWRVYLEDIFVAESHRGRGLLRRLLQPVARLAQSCEIAEIAFSVLDWNENAIAAYKRLGAVETGYKVAEDGVKWLTMAFRGDTLDALAS